MSDQLDTEETQDDILAGEPEPEEEGQEPEPEGEPESEQEEGQGEGDGEDETGDERPGFVEIKDPKIKARVDQLTREKYENHRKWMQERKERETDRKRLEELERKVNPQLDEVKAPDADLAVDDPKAFTEQQQKYSKYLQDKAERDYQDKQRQEQSEAQQQKELSERVDSYAGRAKKLGIGMDDLKKASEQIGQVGVHDDVVNFILDDPDGPAITAHLGSSMEDLLAVAEASPLKAVAHIERMRAKIARKPKSSPPKPPTKVTGTRKSETTAGSGWSIS